MLLVYRDPGAELSAASSVRLSPETEIPRRHSAENINFIEVKGLRAGCREWTCSSGHPGIGISVSETEKKSSQSLPVST